MPINGAEIRGWFRSKKPREWVNEFTMMLGFESPHVGTQRRCCSNGRVVGYDASRCQIPDMSSISFRELACNLFGVQPGDELDQCLMRSPQAWGTLHAMEAGTDVQPGQFANISAFNAAAIGLLEARILQAYQKPVFQVTKLVEHISDHLRALKLIGVSNIGDISKTRNPGERHARANVTERYVTTPVTYNRGAAIEVTREAVLFDYSRQLMQQAETVGDSLALRKEYKILDVMLGIVNTYNYNGTYYYTYQGAQSGHADYVASVTVPTVGPYAGAAATSGAGNWLNYLVNGYTTWTNLETVLKTWILNRDPETNQPISISARQILTMPGNHQALVNVLQADWIRKLANASSATAWPADMLQAKAPFQGMFDIVNDMTYPYAMVRATDTDGLALTVTQANGLWLAGDFKKAFHWHENIPLTTVRANASDYEMADRGLVMGLFADEMGEAGITDPRYVLLNTSA